MYTYLKRQLDLTEPAKRRSLFLFGPRATGKSWLLKQTFPNVPVLDLLDSELYLTLSAQPNKLSSYFSTSEKLIIIDEVQRVPELLNEVHRQIENYNRRFILTGSSSRKLKRGQANLLAGRARTAQLFPLTWSELPTFKLDHYLMYGGIPNIYLSDEPNEDLKSYVDTYLKEEIQAEGLVRKIPDFHRFLRIAALCSGQILNFEKVAQDSQTKPSTVRSYFEILEDTLIGFYLKSWEKGKKRRAIRASKFYLFDPGVTRALAGVRTLEPKSDLWGFAFEQFLVNEVRAHLSYRRKDFDLSYWRSSHGLEIDLIVGNDYAIEFKSTERPNSEDLKALIAITDEGKWKRRLLVCKTTHAQNIQGIDILPWTNFLEFLWGDSLIK